MGGHRYWRSQEDGARLTARLAPLPRLFSLVATGPVALAVICDVGTPGSEIPRGRAIREERAEARGNALGFAHPEGLGSWAASSRVPEKQCRRDLSTP